MVYNYIYILSVSRYYCSVSHIPGLLLYAMIILKVHPVRKLIKSYSIIHDAIIATLRETSID